MASTDKFLLGLFVGLVIWLLKSGITHLIRTQRIKTLLLSDINFHLSNMKTYLDYLENSFQNHFEVGKEVIYGANYTAGNFTLFKSLYPQLAYFLGGQQLEKTLKFYNAATEYEVLLQGLFSDLNGWMHQKHIVTREDEEYLQRKANRIKSIAKIFTENQLKSLKDLPIDYAGKKGASGIVSK